MVAVCVSVRRHGDVELSALRSRALCAKAVQLEQQGHADMSEVMKAELHTGRLLDPLPAAAEVVWLRWGAKPAWEDKAVRVGTRLLLDLGHQGLVGRDLRLSNLTVQWAKPLTGLVRAT
jgi:hypothetical protein